MPLYERRSVIEAPVQELFNWHSKPFAFERLTPPWENIQVVEKDNGIKTGSRVVLKMKQGFLTTRWVAVHADYLEGKGFTDIQKEGPFSKWIHKHSFLAEAAKTSQLVDHIEYELPGGMLGHWLGASFAAKKIERTFNFRHVRTQNDLKRLAHFTQKGPLKIIVSGASGMVGTALTQFLSGAGHVVRSLVRHRPEGGEIYWDPLNKKIDPNSLENVDVVIHLAGENIGAGRWTESRKKKIMESRIEGTKFLVETLTSLKKPPKTLICSSAIGFYGDRGEEVLTEESPEGKGFLTDVCRDWELATAPAKKAGIRVVNVRTGIVLSAKGGALPKMVLPMLMGAGGVIGTGKQWMSWISLEDLVGIFQFLIYAKDITGPVNATAPGALTNSDFIKVLGKVLKRPTFAPLPGFMVKLIFGEMGDALLLEGQQVKPAKLTEAKFEFLYPDLESALRWELGR